MNIRNRDSTEQTIETSSYLEVNSEKPQKKHQERGLLGRKCIALPRALWTALTQSVNQLMCQLQAIKVTLIDKLESFHKHVFYPQAKVCEWEYSIFKDKVRQPHVQKAQFDEPVKVSKDLKEQKNTSKADQIGQDIQTNIVASDDIDDEMDMTSPLESLSIEELELQIEAALMSIEALNSQIMIIHDTKSTPGKKEIDIKETIDRMKLSKEKLVAHIKAVKKQQKQKRSAHVIAKKEAMSPHEEHKVKVKTSKEKKVKFDEGTKMNDGKFIKGMWRN